MVQSPVLAAVSLLLPLMLGVITTQCPVPEFQSVCSWTMSQIPHQEGTQLSVQTKLTLNKFKYTLYKKASPSLILQAS